MPQATGDTIGPPKGRSEQLIVQPLDGEVLVYDLDRHKAHCLSPIAATVWKNCNGIRTVAELADMTNCELDAPLRERLVLHILDELAGRHLLLEPEKVLDNVGVSRRKVMKDLVLGMGVAAGAGLTLPLIKSIVVPTPAQASSLPSPG